MVEKNDPDRVDFVYTNRNVDMRRCVPIEIMDFEPPNAQKRTAMTYNRVGRITAEVYE